MALVVGEEKLRKVVARRIRLAMARLQMNQATLARGSGLTPSGVSLILKGKRTPDLTTLQAIGETIGKPVEWLMGKGDS